MLQTRLRDEHPSDESDNEPIPLQALAATSSKPSAPWPGSAARKPRSARQGLSRTHPSPADNNLLDGADNLSHTERAWVRAAMRDEKSMLRAERCAARAAASVLLSQQAAGPGTGTCLTSCTHAAPFSLPSSATQGSAGRSGPCPERLESESLRAAGAQQAKPLIHDIRMPEDGGSGKADMAPARIRGGNEEVDSRGEAAAGGQKLSQGQSALQLAPNKRGKGAPASGPGGKGTSGLATVGSLPSVGQGPATRTRAGSHVTTAGMGLDSDRGRRALNSESTQGQLLQAAIGTRLLPEKQCAKARASIGAGPATCRHMQPASPGNPHLIRQAEPIPQDADMFQGARVAGTAARCPGHLKAAPQAATHAERSQRKRRAPSRLADLPDQVVARQRRHVGKRAHSPDVRRAGSKSQGQPCSSSPSPRGVQMAVPAHKPRLGRVKRCSSKQVKLTAVGVLCLRPGWHNNGYIFPDGFHTRTVFRSSVQLDALCVHECEIVGTGGAFWPAPTFRVTAADRPHEPLEAKSATGCWNAILARINGEIEQRRQRDTSLPPPPKTAIAGPEYFGLTHPSIVAQLEALDHDRRCTLYWHGKEDRLAYGQVHGVSPDRKGPQQGRADTERRPRRLQNTSGPAPPRPGRCVRRRLSDNDPALDADEAYVTNRWSAVDRAMRARRRHAVDDNDSAAPGGNTAGEDEDLLPGVLDPITLEPVVTPAISPAGHVMGLATWAAVLAEQGKCPFTQAPLRREQITVLTKVNIQRHRERMILA